MAGRAGNWTAAERLYLSDYLKSGAREKLPAAKARYTLLLGITAKGEQLLVTGDEIEAVKGQDGRYGYVLTDEGTQAGLVRLQWTTAVYNDRGLHGLMGSYVYGNQTLWDFAKRAGGPFIGRLDPCGCAPFIAPFAMSGSSSNAPAALTLNPCPAVSRDSSKLNGRQGFAAHSSR